MPQLDQAKKALRSSMRRRAVNDRWRRRLREALRAVREALAAGSAKEAQTAVLTAESVLDRLARRNIIPPNKASRKKSRLRKAAAKLTA